MNIVVKYLIVILFAYIIGSSSMSLNLSKQKGINLVLFDQLAQDAFDLGFQYICFLNFPVT